MGNSTPCKIVTPENIILKICTRNYVGEMTHRANFGFNRRSEGFSPNMRNITTLWHFDCAQVEPLDRSSRFMAKTTCFRARMVLLGKYAHRTPAHFWEFCGNTQFQAKTSKNKNRHISKTMDRIKTKFDDLGETNNYTSWVVEYYPDQIQYSCRPPSWKNGHDLITPQRIVRFWRNLAGRCKITRRKRKLGENRKRK